MLPISIIGGDYMVKKVNKSTGVLGNWDWKIGGKKLLINIAIVLVSGFITVYQDNPAYLALIPLAQLVLNFLKNR